MTDEEFAQVLQIGHETRQIEFKSPGRRDDGHAFAIVARAMMAMANSRGGGFVVIGVSENADGSPNPVGVPDPADYGWTDFDAICGRLSAYCESGISFEIGIVRHEGKQCVVLTVDEFSEYPVVCKAGHTSQADPARGRQGPVEVLKAGACYVRSRRKPESIAVSTAEDMRVLIDFAAEKALVRYAALKRIEQAHSGSGEPPPSERYNRETEGLL